MPNLLLTGASGFLGRIMTESFSKKFTVVSVGRRSSDILVDLSKEIPKIGQEVDTVVHAAGKAHVVPKSGEEKKEFFDVNVNGTVNLLAGLASQVKNIKSFVFISTVSVYGCDSGDRISESHPLNANTPYGKSKVKAEEILREWCDNHKIPLLILRLPLIAGPMPLGNLGAMINGIKSHRYFSINKGVAQRSIVMASDVAEFILEKNGTKGTYNLTDDYDPSFREIEIVIANQLNKAVPKSIPLFFAKFLGKIGDVFSFFPLNSYRVEKMTQDLTFSCEKAKKDLNWTPNKVLDHFKIM